MTSVFYHATPEKNRDSIIQNGLRPTECSECQCQLGVHLAPTLNDAYQWINRLRDERDNLYYADFVIFQVTLSDSQTVVKDEFIDFGPDSVIACTESIIPPENLGVFEVVP